MSKKTQTALIPISLRCVLCGAVTGASIFFFKYAATKVEQLSRAFYGFAGRSPLRLAAVFALVLLLAFATYLLHRRVPEVRGGGIPRSEGILRGVLNYRPLTTLFGTVVGSFISFFCGLPLGSEGPAVLIGTSVGGCFCGKNGAKSAYSRYVMTGGAGAGFAVATCAPLSAMLFALEEIHKRFTPILVLSVSLSVLSATTVNKALCDAFGLKTSLFEIAPLEALSFGDAGWLVLLGAVTALAVAMFDKSIDRFSAFSAKVGHRLPKGFGIILVFAVSAVLGVVFPEGLYSGHHIIEELLFENSGVLMLLLILGVRLVMMLFVTGSSATGGIFIPTLAIGALVGALAGKLLVFLGMPQELYDITVLLGMCAFLGGTLRAPLTAAVLFSELTGQFSDFFYVSVVIFTVMLITDVLNFVPFYDRVLEGLEKAQNKGKKPEISYFSMTVSEKAFVTGKAVRDIMWPHASVVVSVRRAGNSTEDTDNDGEKKLYPGDRLVIRARFYDEEQLKDRPKGLIGEDAEICRTQFSSTAQAQ